MAETDLDTYREQHRSQFGHAPVPALDGRAHCVHPMHDQIRRLIDGEGVDILLDFESAEIYAEDSPEMEHVRGQYEEMKAGYAGMIERVREMEAFMARRGQKKWY